MVRRINVEYDFNKRSGDFINEQINVYTDWFDMIMQIINLSFKLIINFDKSYINLLNVIDTTHLSC